MLFLQGGGSMVIYLDRVFFLNGLVDYLLLVVCGSVTASPLRRGRIALAACLGGLYAAACLLPGTRFLEALPIQLLLAAILSAAAFGTGRGMLRRTGVLLLLAAAFSGLVLILTELFSAPAAVVGRRVYYPVSFGALALTAGGAFSLMKWALSRMGHQGGDVAHVTVELRGRRAVLTALRDTGNTLTDPISGCPVLVTDPAVLRRLLPELTISARTLERPAELLEVLKAWGLRPRLIPYHTVGVKNGLLLALRPEQVTVDGRREAMLMAFSPVPVSDGGGYQALIGGNL